MGKITLDLAGRLPALELITPSKPVRELIKPTEPFDFHLKQARDRPTRSHASASTKPPTVSDRAHHTSQPNNDQPSPVEAKDSPSAQAESETSDADSPESRVTDPENEIAAGAAGEEKEDQNKEDADGDEVILNDEAVQAAQGAPNAVAFATDSSEPGSEQDKQNATAIDSKVNSERDAKKLTQDTTSGNKPEANSQVAAATKSTTGDQSADGDDADTPHTATDASKVNQEQKESKPQEVYTAAPRQPLVSEEAESTVAKSSATDDSAEGKQSQQASTETKAEALLDESKDGAKVSASKNDPHAHKEGGSEDRSLNQNNTQQTKADLNARLANAQPPSSDNTLQSQALQSGAIQDVTQAATNSLNGDASAQTLAATTNSNNASQIVPAADTNAPAANNSAARASGSIREASFGRAAKASAQTQGTDTSATIDRARFIQRVSRALHISHERGGEIRLRLSPPELGSLTVDIKLKDGVLTAKLEAETPAAQKLLLDHSSVLKDRLADQQIRVDRFDVDLADRSSQNPQQGQQRGSAEQRQARGPIKNSLTSANREAEPATSRDHQPIPTGTGQLNVVI